MPENLTLSDLSTPEGKAILKDYLYRIWEDSEIIYTESAPNGSISAKRGKIAIYKNGSTYEQWQNIDGATTWQRMDLAGTIGGFTVSASSLTAGSGANSVGLTPATYPFFAGNATPASAPFYVTAAGAIHATSGDIAGWNLVTGYLYSLVSGTPTSSPSDGIVIASTNPVITFYENTEKRIELGYLAAGIFGLKGYDDDGTTVLFEISDTQKLFAGWTVSSTSLVSGSGANTVGLDSGGTNPAIYAGSATPGSAPFRVTKAGVVTATSGTIGGWTLASDKLTGGSGSTYIALIPGTGIQMGNETFGSAPFSVTNAGVLKAISGTIGGWILAATTLADNATVADANILLDKANALIRLGDTASTYLTLDGANNRIRTSDYVTGPLGAGWNIDTSIAEFNNIRARGKISTSVFEKDVISSIGGNFLVSDSDILNADMTAADDYDSYTKLASHFDGADAATAYTDPVAGAYTFVATAQLDTAQKKFGTASLLLDGDSDYVTLPDSADWTFGTGDFTIECWVKINSGYSGTQGMLGQFEDGNHQWIVYLLNGGIYFYWYINEYLVIINTSAGVIPNDGAWHHVAIVRSGTTGKLFADGVSQSYTGTDFGSSNLADMTAVLKVGGANNNFLNGWIDEVRISKGIARWTANFTPPTAAYGTNITILGDTTFAVDDILRIKDGVDDEWFKVIDVSGAPVYGVNRDQASAYAAGVNPVWKKGTAIVNFGASGEGLIFMTASEANSPHIDVVTHAGSPWSTLTTRMRIGNVNGFLGAASDLYGIYIGETAKFLKYDPTNGLQIRGGIISTAASGARVEILPDANTGLVIYDNAGTPAKVFEALIGGTDVGDVIFGTPATAYMKWDKSAGKLLIADVESPDYVANTTGYKLSSASGLEVNTGTIQGVDLIAKMMLYAMMFGGN